MINEKCDAYNYMTKLNIAILVLIAGLFFTSARVDGADWRFYAETEAEDMKFYYDADSITHLPESIVQVRIREMYANDAGKHEIVEIRKWHGLPTEGFENFKFTVELWAINCTDKMHKLLLIEYYNNKNSILDSNYSDSGNWSPIVLDSAGEKLYEILCRETGS